MAGKMASITVEKKKGYELFRILSSRGVWVRKETLQHGKVRVLCSFRFRTQLDDLSKKYDELHDVIEEMSPETIPVKSLKDEMIGALSLGWSAFIVFFSIFFSPYYFNELSWDNDNGLYFLLGIIPFVVLVWAALLNQGSKEEYSGKDYYLVILSNAVYYPFREGSGFSSLALPILTVVITSSLALWFYIRAVFG